MAAIEVPYQGIGKWTLDRTAMCKDNINMQWMTATGITYTPSSTLPEGSVLKPGGIKDIPDNKEYSILRLANNDAGGSKVTFSEVKYTAGSPGMSEYHVAGLPYNGTSFELLNCINYTDIYGDPQSCATSDTITVFNNSVYADADVRIVPGGARDRQEVNICTDTYELKANDPQSFKGNGDIVEYETHGMWGFDEKDFKGLYTGDKNIYVENSTLYNTYVHNLRPSDNHQRANALIWCVYKSIIPPTCEKHSGYCDTHVVPPNQYSPLRAYCAYGKEFHDFYESDPTTHQIYWYAKKKDSEVDYSVKYFQIAYTLCGKQRYGFIKSTYTSEDCSTADDEEIVHAMYKQSGNT
jgi:hypothetical protein